jgi:hypothetical protein
MNQITISKNKIDKQRGVVILPLKEYERLIERSAPTYYLTGKSAEDLDKLVTEGLKEHRAGKTRKVRSISDLD